MVGPSDDTEGEEPLEPGFEERLSQRVRSDLAAFLVSDIIPKVESVMGETTAELRTAIKGVQDSIPTHEQMVEVSTQVVSAVLQTKATPTQTTSGIVDQLQEAGEILDGTVEEVPAKVPAKGEMASKLYEKVMEDPIGTVMDVLDRLDKRSMMRLEMEQGMHNPFLMMKKLEEVAPDLVQWRAETKWATNPIEELIPGMLAKSGGETFSAGFKAGAAAKQATAQGGGPVVAPNPLEPDSNNSRPSNDQHDESSEPRPAENVPKPEERSAVTGKGSVRGKPGEPVGFLSLSR